MAKYVFKKRWKCRFAAIFDAVGGIAFFFLRKNFVIPPGHVKKILLTRIDHLGDALLLRPVLQQLRKAQPDLQIHVLTTPENMPVFLLDPFINRVISFPGHWFQKEVSFFKLVSAFRKMVSQIRIEKYDAAVDFRGDVRMNLLLFLAGIPIRVGYGITGGGWMLTHEKPWSSAEHQVALNQKLLSDWVEFEPNLKNPGVNYPVSTITRLKAKTLNMQWPYAVIHMGAGNPLKEWPFDCFVRLMENLKQSGLVKTFFLVGTDGERLKSQGAFPEYAVDLRGLTDLHELACLMDGAAFFVGNDSGPAHLAAAQGIPVVLISSSTNDIRYWHPWTKKMGILPAVKGESVSVAQAEAAAFSLMSQG